MKFPRSNYSEYKKSVICFIDILGFEQLVLMKDADQIHYTLSKVFKSLLKPTPKESFKYTLKIKNTSIRDIPMMIENGTIEIDTEIQGEISYFSDTVIISFPIEEDENSNIERLQSLLAKIDNLFHRFFRKFESDLSIRGSIVIGDIYHSGNIFFGPGLNDAYKLESKKAVIPRVIFSKTMSQLDWVEKAINTNTFLDHYDYTDISKLDDEYVSISLLKINNETINQTFKYFNLTQVMEESSDEKQSPFLWVLLRQKLKFLERSSKRVMDITDLTSQKKEQAKLERMIQLYYDNLNYIIQQSCEVDLTIIDNFKKQYQVKRDKYKEHSFDRKNTKLLIEDPIHIYSQSTREMPYFHGNCCSGIVTNIISGAKVNVKQNGTVATGTKDSMKRLCNHPCTIFEIETKYIEKDKKYSFD